MQSFEIPYYKQGFTCIAGVDEAGRGSLAGPVVSAAVILKPDFNLPGLNDSKKLSPLKREKLFKAIQTQAFIGLGFVDASRIDKINILAASLEAMLKAVKNLPSDFDLLLVDGRFTIDLDCRQEAIIGGDGKSASIAAASIVAKVTRDNFMKEMDTDYPAYGFASHKGYPTSAHKKAIASLGVLPVHRRSFKGVKEFL